MSRCSLRASRRVTSSGARSASVARWPRDTCSRQPCPIPKPARWWTATSARKSPTWRETSATLTRPLGKTTRARREKLVLTNGGVEFHQAALTAPVSDLKSRHFLTPRLDVGSARIDDTDVHVKDAVEERNVRQVNTNRVVPRAQVDGRTLGVGATHQHPRASEDLQHEVAAVGGGRGDVHVEMHAGATLHVKRTGGRCHRVDVHVSAVVLVSLV